MSAYQPPFGLNYAMLSQVAKIGEWLGRWKQANRDELVPHLRRGNRIRTIQASLAQVPRLMDDLLKWLGDTEAHPLIASCAVHYELEFIYTFSDGNGRVGRL